MKVIAIFLVLLLGWTHTGWACSCRPRSFEENYNTASAVFVGKVIPVSGAFGTVMEVTGYWKSSAPVKTMTISTLMLGGRVHPCAFLFKPGQKYLIFAYKAGNNLTTDSCSGTKPMSLAQEELKKLGPAKQPE